MLFVHTLSMSVQAQSPGAVPWASCIIKYLLMLYKVCMTKTSVHLIRHILQRDHVFVQKQNKTKKVITSFASCSVVTKLQDLLTRNPSSEWMIKEDNEWVSSFSRYYKQIHWTAFFEQGNLFRGRMHVYLRQDLRPDSRRYRTIIVLLFSPCLWITPTFSTT